MRERETHVLHIRCPACGIEMLRFERAAHPAETAIAQSIASSRECRACDAISQAIARERSYREQETTR